MFKIAILILLIVHAGIHLIGFAKAMQFAQLRELSMEIPRSFGWLWLGVSILFILSAVFYFSKWPLWWGLAAVAVVISQILIIISWQDAKFGTIINIILVLAIGVAIGQWSFQRRAQNQARNFVEAKIETVDNSEVGALPEVVADWRETCASKQDFSIVKFQQRGKMKTSPESAWKEFEAEQWSSVETPEFIWKVDVGQGSFLQFNGLDKLRNGRGSMQILAYGLFPIVNSTGQKTDEASAIRYLAEMVWYPEAVGKLPVEWESVAENQFRATLSTDDFSVSGVFIFNEINRPVAFEAMRYNDQTGKPEKWVVAIDPESYFTDEAATIPARATITWELDDIDFTWYEVEIIDRKGI